MVAADVHVGADPLITQIGMEGGGRVRRIGQSVPITRAALNEDASSVGCGNGVWSHRRGGLQH